MAIKQYEATATCAFPLKDGSMLSIVYGNVYDLDLTKIHKHHQVFLIPTDAPSAPVHKVPKKKPAKVEVPDGDTTNDL